MPVVLSVGSMQVFNTNISYTHLKTYVDCLIFFKRPEPFLLKAQLDFASYIIASETEA